MKIEMNNSIRPVLGEGPSEVIIERIKVLYEEETRYGLKDLFEISYKSDDGKSITQKYIAYYNKSGQFGKVVLAVLGELPDEFDTKQLVGKRCKITVGISVSQKNNRYPNVIKVEASELTAEQIVGREYSDDLNI